MGEIHFLNTLGGITHLTAIDESVADSGASADGVIVWDNSASEFKYMTLDNLQDEIDTSGSAGFSASDITGATDLGNNVASGDSIVIHDTSASALAEMTIGNLQAYMQSNLTFTTNTNTNQLTTFQLEDNAGTEVTISHAKEVKLIGGTGITTAWTDTSNGSDGDPYDMTISLDIDEITSNASDADSVLTIDGDGTLTAEAKLQFNETNGLVIQTNKGIRINNADDNRNARLYNSGASSYSNIDFWTGNNNTPRKVMSIDHLGKLSLGHDGTNKTFVFPANNTGASAGDVLAFPSSGYELEWVANPDTNTNRLTTFTLTGDSGTNQTIADSNTLTVAGGNAISTVVGATDTITINHDDTSSQASVNNSGRTYIQDITLDTYGHVTGITSATETVTDTNTTTTADVVTALNADLGGNFTVGTQSNDIATFTGGLNIPGASAATNNTPPYDGYQFRDRQDLGMFEENYSILIKAPEEIYMQLDSNNNNSDDAFFAITKNGKTSHSGSHTQIFKVMETGNVYLPIDSAKLYFGADDDMFITHDGSHATIQNDTGLLNLDGQTGIYADVNGSNIFRIMSDHVGSWRDFRAWSQTRIRFYDADTSNYVALRAPDTVSSNLTWKLPDADGSAGQVLTTDASGNLSFTSKTVNTDTNTTYSAGTLLDLSSTTFNVDLSEATEAAVAVADDYFLFLDGGATGTAKKEAIADLVAAIAGNNITATNGVLSVAADTNTTYSAGTGLALSTTTFNLDVDGLTDIGEGINDADLLIIDNGANGTTRKTTFSRVKTWIGDNVSELRIRDARNEGPSTSTEMRPTDFADKSATFTFTDDITSSTNAWDAVMTMKGWSDNYRAWQIFSASDSSSNSVDTEPLYFRTGEADLNTTLTSDDGGWGVRREILTFPGTTPNADGSANQVLRTNGSGALTWENQTDTTYSAGNGLALSGTTFSINDPVNLSQLTESSDATSDKILLWDESTSAWKYMTLDDLQDSIDTTGSGGESNQNAFSNVAVSGQTTVAADSATDTLTLVEGSNVTITTNASTDSVTIASLNTNTTYSGGTNLTLVGTTFNVDDAFLKNNANDSTSGTLTAANFVTAGSLTVGTNIVHQGDTNNTISFGTDTQSFNTSSSTRLFIDTAGEIGIGTTSPVPKLHIYGNDTSTNTNSAAHTGITIENAGTGDATLSFLETGTQRWMMGLDNSDSDKFKIETGATSLGTGAAFTIATGGDVGINQTSPAAQLHIKGSENSWDKHIRLENHDTTDYGAIVVDNQGMKFRIFTNTHDFYFRDNDNNTLLQIQDGAGIKFNNAYEFPTSDGSANQVLTTDGNGTLTFENAGGGSSTDSFMIFGEESDDYLGPASAGNANGFSFSYGNGAQNTTKSATGADFGIPLGCDCTLKAVYIHFGNKNSRTSSTNLSIDVFKNNAQLNQPMTGNASGSGGNSYIVSKTNYNINFSAGDTFNMRVESPTTYTTATQVGPARMTAYFERQ